MEVDGKTIRVNSITEVLGRLPNVYEGGVKEIVSTSNIDSITLRVEVPCDISILKEMMFAALNGYIKTASTEEITGDYIKQSHTGIISERGYYIGNFYIGSFIRNGQLIAYCTIDINGMKSYDINRDGILNRFYTTLVYNLSSFNLTFTVQRLHIAIDVVMPTNTYFKAGVKIRKNGVTYVEDLTEEELSNYKSYVKDGYLEILKYNINNSYTKRKHEVTTGVVYDKVISKDGYTVKRFEVRIEKNILATLINSIRTSQARYTNTMYINALLDKADSVIDKYYMLYANTSKQYTKVNGLYNEFNKAKGVGGRAYDANKVNMLKDELEKYRVKHILNAYNSYAYVLQLSQRDKTVVTVYSNISNTLHNLYAAGTGLVNGYDIVEYNNMGYVI